MKDNYEYDVAFSFLAEDEQLAKDIADRIRDRVSVFIYFEQQKNLIANDGVDTFSSAFKEQSRVAVVLYRERWGQTKWTRIEEIAIKSRYHDEGPEFLIVVSLDRKTPGWYPSFMIWADLERYRVDGIASVIERKVGETGGTVKRESIEDYAAKLGRKVNFNRDRENWRASEKGVHDANEEVAALYEELTSLAEKIRNDSEHFLINCHQENLRCNLKCDEHQLTLVWGQELRHNLDGAMLHVRLLRQYYDETSWGNGSFKTVTLDELKYEPDMTLSRNIGWRELSDKKTFVSSTQLAEIWFRRLLDEVSSDNEETNDII